ncbi:MAG: histidine phosphatase family protein [Candidatus Thiodiazotropha sp. (ex Dulcina madagascariensis)]|nr:histidine phosphatase family protein [Candidatus Thiodiazotropha sp. (ex Dulcina madagascariensis)]
MHIFLIRHLQTNFNKNGIIQGKLDIPIIEPNIEILQKIKVNQRLIEAEAPFDSILHSEYQRTIMTAACYGFEQQAKVEPLLNELDFGQFEGKPRKELMTEYGELWLNDPEKIVFGESLSELGNRISSFINKYKDKKKILIFGHGAWMRALYAMLYYKNISKMNQHTIDNNTLIHMYFKV